jgi:hypothetical protein
MFYIESDRDCGIAVSVLCATPLCLCRLVDALCNLHRLIDVL